MLTSSALLVFVGPFSSYNILHSIQILFSELSVHFVEYTAADDDNISYAFTIVYIRNGTKTRVIQNVVVKVKHIFPRKTDEMWELEMTRYLHKINVCHSFEWILRERVEWREGSKEKHWLTWKYTHRDKTGKCVEKRNSYSDGIYISLKFNINHFCITNIIIDWMFI